MLARQAGKRGFIDGLGPLRVAAKADHGGTPNSPQIGSEPYNESGLECRISRASSGTPTLLVA
jgi:hypothetical protein